MLTTTRSTHFLPAQHAALSSRPFTQVCWRAHSRRQCGVNRAVAEAATAETTGQAAAAPPSMQGLGDTYAVIDIGGVQHIVEEGRWYTCNRIDAQPGATIKLGRVLAHKIDGSLNVGQPYLSDVTVEAQVLEELKGPKLIVYKHKPKKHYQRKTGHRQSLSKFLVTKIAA